MVLRQTTRTLMLAEDETKRALGSYTAKPTHPFGGEQGQRTLDDDVVGVVLGGGDEVTMGMVVRGVGDDGDGVQMMIG
ncbi:hypothetical protein Tco_0572305 [Tanacetum coccineum]